MEVFEIFPSDPATSMWSKIWRFGHSSSGTDIKNYGHRIVRFCSVSTRPTIRGD